MKRFTFSLESLHRYKKRQKLHLENLFADLCREFALQHKQLDRLKDDLLRLSEPGAKPRSRESLQDRLAASGYSARTRQLIDHKTMQVVQLREDCNRMREQLLLASQEVESLETLRANQLAEHRSRNSRIRQQELQDHLANGLFDMEKEETR